MKTLLIVAHAPSSNTKKIVQAIQTAVSSNTDLNIITRAPLKTTSQCIQAADGVVFFTPENFGYMSGALKDLFDRTYYDVIETKRGTPYALIVRAGKDGTGCKRAVESILKGLGWRACQAPLILLGEHQASFEEEGANLVSAVASSLELGII